MRNQQLFFRSGTTNQGESGQQDEYRQQSLFVRNDPQEKELLKFLRVLIAPELDLVGFLGVFDYFMYERIKDEPM
jgi:hypothetical protein